VNDANSCGIKCRLSKPKRVLFFVAGSISLGLGVLGVVLPVLPTTPFLLLSVACYCRSSERMYRWMLSNKLFGRYISNYRAGKGIPLKTKIFAVVLLWLLIGYSVVFLVGILFVQVILFAVAVGVTVHLVKLPTFRG